MIWEWLEATGLARALGQSVWVYPLVNAGHLFGIALLVGSIVPLDLRLLGAWRAQPLAPLWRVLTRTAAAGLAIAILFGALLFITRATEYVASGLFVAKMIVVAVAAVNALAVRALVPDAPGETKPSGFVRLAGAVSLMAWLSALVLGRLVGYF